MTTFRTVLIPLFFSAAIAFALSFAAAPAWALEPSGESDLAVSSANLDGDESITNTDVSEAAGNTGDAVELASSESATPVNETSQNSTESNAVQDGALDSSGVTEVSTEKDAEANDLEEGPDCSAGSNANKTEEPIVEGGSPEASETLNTTVVEGETDEDGQSALSSTESDPQSASLAETQNATEGDATVSNGEESLESSIEKDVEDEIEAQGDTNDGEPSETLTTASSSDEFSPSDAADLIAKMMGAAATLDPAEVVSTFVEWGVGEFISSVFGIPIGNDAELQEILNGIKDIKEKLGELQTTVNNAQLNTIMNSLFDLLDKRSSYDVFNALNSIDNKLAKGVYTKEEAEQRRISALTKSLGMATLAEEASVENSYDTFVLDMWAAMTGAWRVTINGQTQDMSLMQVDYESLRMEYHWEHQAYDKWADFQARSVGLLMTSLTLEKASLVARINHVVEWNKTHSEKIDEDALTSRLYTIQDYINRAAGFKGTYTDKDGKKKEVNYPGLFSKKTWSEQYWMYKKRDDVRYYWTPGHEILFYAKVNTQHVPPEREDHGYYRGGLYGLYRHYTDETHFRYEINYDYWKPFLRYQGGDTLLVSADQLRTIYNDYKGTSLYDIFIGEGKFTGLEGNFPNDWWFVVDQDKGHPLVLQSRIFDKDRLYFYVLSGTNAKTDQATLAYYGENSSKSQHATHYIGIGVKRVGPETYKPTKNIEPEVHTAIINSLPLWWPSLGNLALTYGNDEQGDVEQVFMDGSLLDKSCYTIKDGVVTLSQSYMSTLSFGEHKLLLDTEHGGHTIVLSTQADGVYRTVSGSGSTWKQASNDSLTFVFKRTTNDEITFLRLMGVLVDGLAVPTGSYIARAGSAIITLTPAYLATLPSGTHTLTALFEDGNNPQATFTVKAASNGGNESNDVAQVTIAKDSATPSTGDGTAPVITLLTLLASISSALVLRLGRKSVI